MNLRRNFKRSKPWFYALGVLSVLLVVLLVQVAVADDNGDRQKTQSQKEEGLELNSDPKINALAEKYFSASMRGNTDVLKEIVKPFSESDQAAALRKSEFIESYDDIKCYKENGIDEGNYIVFVTYDLKFPEVDTMVPGLETWVVSTDDNGDLFINKDMESISDAMNEQIETLLARKDVVALFNDVNAKMAEALKADEQLKSLYQQMGGNAEEAVSENEQDTTSTKEPQETEAPVGTVEREMVAVVELEIYENPSQDDSPLGKLSVGSFVWVDKNVQGGFSYVDKDGTVGYVLTSGLATYQAVDEEIKATVNYYSSCDANAPVMGTITSDNSYYCTLEYSNGWRQIVVNDTKVYVKKSDLGLTEDTSQQATDAPKATEKAVETDEPKATEKSKAKESTAPSESKNPEATNTPEPAKE